MGCFSFALGKVWYGNFHSLAVVSNCYGNFSLLTMNYSEYVKKYSAPTSCLIFTIKNQAYYLFKAKKCYQVKRKSCCLFHLHYNCCLAEYFQVGLVGYWQSSQEC